MSDASDRPPEFDLERARAAYRRNPGALWSHVDELLEDPAFQRWVDAEFPAAPSRLKEPGRREFLRLMGASLMLTGLAACGPDSSDFALPYVSEPEQELPGVPRLYATAVCFEGFAQPVVARTDSGRPTKLDGNPDHPATRGDSDVFMQTAVLQLYDPDRSKAPLRDGIPTTWAAVERELVELHAGWAERQGQGLRILTGRITSPTVLRQVRRLTADLPQARVHLFEPVGAGLRPHTMREAFGQEVEPRYRLEQCEAIVSLDDDLLGPGPHQVFHARAWAERHGEVHPGEGRTRLYVAESVPGLTGVVASQRLILDPSRIRPVSQVLASALGVSGIERPDVSPAERAWIEAAAQALKTHAGHSLLTCGAHLDPGVQGLAPWINHQLGNAGRTVEYIRPLGFSADEAGTLQDLAHDIAAGAVETLIILDSNPVYSAPGSLSFGELLRRIPTTIHAGLYVDETAAMCRWHLPLAHALESWGDARSVDGIATLVQPVVAPLYSVRTLPQIMAMLAGAIDTPSDTPVRDTWAATFGVDFDSRWRQSLRDGFIAQSAPSPIVLSPHPPELAQLAAPADGQVEVTFRPDPCVWDGRFSNVAWLQEMPKPLSKVTWDSPVSISPRIADQLKLANGDLVEVSAGGRSITGPAWISPGQAPNTVALSLGYGRQTGAIAADLGYSAYAIRPSDDRWFTQGKLRRIAGRRSLASSQGHHRLEGFDFVKEVSAERPRLPPQESQATLYPSWDAGEYAWGMVIDLDRCIGCNACIAACNIENNVLVVGKDEVANGREMLWLRVDHYYSGDIEDPTSYFQPVPCMHCENAPCEMGCPVNATVHNAEGLNQQVYNRCIGTRTCSSYCPYKVRRFNWYDYRRFDEPSRAAYNPDVTVRGRGVMEKCTYCTQRIQAAHVAADKDNRTIAAGEVVTACQQACPTTAIIFGNIKNPTEEIAKLRQSDRHYVLLEHLGTRPRTTYLARWNDRDDKR